MIWNYIGPPRCVDKLVKINYSFSFFNYDWDVLKAAAPSKALPSWR